MKRLYVFGNEHLSSDSMARRVAAHLKGVEIVHCRSPEELLETIEDRIMILDVVKGATEPIVIDEINKLKTRNLVSLHDFDLGFFLNLMQTLRGNIKVMIIGLPEKGNPVEIAVKVASILDKA